MVNMRLQGVRSESFTTTLSSAECRVLADLLRDTLWWEIRTRFGVSADVVKRASRGEPILTTTAALLRRLLGELAR
jgi:hypothetical protein